MTKSELDSFVADYGFDQKECEGCQKNFRTAFHIIQRESRRLKFISRRAERCANTVRSAIPRMLLNDTAAELHQPTESYRIRLQKGQASAR